MNSVLRFIAYGPGFDVNKHNLADAVRRREASPFQEVREAAGLKQIERAMSFTNTGLIWIWRSVVASAVVAIVLLSLGI